MNTPKIADNNSVPIIKKDLLEVMDTLLGHSESLFDKSIKHSEGLFIKSREHAEELFARSTTHAEELFIKSTKHADELFLKSTKHSDDLFGKSTKHTDELFGRAIAHTDESTESLVGMIARRFDGVEKTIDELEYEMNRRFASIKAQLDNIYLNNLTRREHDYLRNRVEKIERKLKIA